MHLQMVLGQRRRDLPELAARRRRNAVAASRRATSTASSVVTTTTIVEAEQRHELLVARHIGAARIDEDRRAVRGIAGGVARRQFPDRLPGADVRPAIRHRHHRRARRAFHHRVVDRFRRAARERVDVERDEAEIGAGGLQRGRDRGGAVGLEAAVFVEQEARAEHEIAGVPEIALGDIARRGLGVGLFDKPFDREQAWSERRAGTDVTVFGRGRVGSTPNMTIRSSSAASRPRAQTLAKARGSVTT